MTEWLASNESSLRLIVFVVVLLALMALEAMLPRRKVAAQRRQRWPANLSIVVINTVVSRLLLPILPVGAALLAAERGIGLMPIIDAPFWLSFIACIVLLDLAIYWQHRLLHALPSLWRIHRMHHADTVFDVTTGARFHPLEIVLSLAFKLLVVLLLGAPVEAVIAFEIILNATSMFNHANLRLPAPVDACLRCLIVTPDMHRVHHSTIRQETDSNFGFNLPWWDWLFATYRAAPAAGHDNMRIGIEAFRDSGEQRLDRLLTQPFRRS
ncbi:MAG: sterol desaturase family protein [Pseudomonadota bacterium]